MSSSQPPNPSDSESRPTAWHERVEASILELHHAEGCADLLRALLAPAMASGASGGVLALCEPAASAEAALRTVATIGTEGTEADPELDLGRVPYSELAQAGWTAASGSTVIAIGDVAADTSLGDALRRVLAAMGARAVLALPLSAGPRGAGLALLGWAAPTAFAEELIAAYRLLLRPAGWALRTCLLLAAADRAYSDRERVQKPAERAVFEALLQHLPLGVALVDAESRRVLWKSRLVDQLFPSVPGDARAEVREHEALPIFPPGSREPPAPQDSPVGRALRTGQAVTGAGEAVHPERGRLALETLAVPVKEPDVGVRSVLLFLQDVTERQRREQEQLRLQDALISDQAAMLAERSMPLIPLSNEVLIMPIIGSVDAARAEQMMDSLLQGVSSRPCRFAILDITGVNVVDSHAASALLRASQALRLLGVEPVLTGIRAEVAQTLVRLGIDLSALTTCSTVQAGIAYTTRSRSARSG